MKKLTAALYAIIIAFSQAKSKSKDNVASSQILPSGIALQFNDKAALPTLSTWAREISTHGYTVSHHDAVSRESQVVELVNSGKWTAEAYHDYQRMAASTGNVDSSRLLVEYSIGPDVFGGFVNPFAAEEGEEKKSKTKYLKTLHKGLVSCDTSTFKAAANKIGLTWLPLLRLSALPDAGGVGGTTILMGASFLGCVDIVSFLLDELLDNSDFDVDEVGSHGATALLVAASAPVPAQTASSKTVNTPPCAHCSVITMLVQRGGANINFRHRFAVVTALHMAAEVESATIPTICSLGADVTATSATGGTALHTAAHSGARKSIAALLTHCRGVGVDDLMNRDTTALYLAAQHGHVKAVEVLLSFNASIDFSMPRLDTIVDRSLRKRENGDQTPAMVAINSQAGNGATALHAAAENGHTMVVRALGRAGADLNSLALGTSPLHLAVQYKHPAVLRELISFGADVNIRSQVDGVTPLCTAAVSGQNDLIEALAAAGASVDMPSSVHGGFPLLQAALNGHTKTVRLLLKLGANRTSTTPNGLTAFLAAVSRGHVASARVLGTYSGSGKQNAGNVLDAVGPQRQTAFHLTALSGNVQMLKLLSELMVARTEASHLSPVEQHERALQGMNLLQHPDSSGYMPLHLAVRSEQPVEVLQNLHAIAISLLTLLGVDTGSGVASVCETWTDCVCPRQLQNDGLGPSPLHLVVGSREHTAQLANTEHLMNIGCDPNALFTFEETSSSAIESKSNKGSAAPQRKQSSALLAAVGHGNDAVVRLLLGLDRNAHKKKPVDKLPVVFADPNKGVGSGATSHPLLLVTVKGYHKVIRSLLQADASCSLMIQTSQQQNSGARDGETLVDIATRLRQFDALQELLRHPQCDPEFIRAGNH